MEQFPKDDNELAHSSPVSAAGRTATRPRLSTGRKVADDRNRSRCSQLRQELPSLSAQYGFRIKSVSYALTCLRHSVRLWMLVVRCVGKLQLSGPGVVLLVAEGQK